MNQNLRESIVHGSTEYPFTIYRIQTIPHSFSVSLHWHDEVEIIYIKEGTLHLTIDKISYECHAGDIFIVNSQDIHEMYVEDTDVIYYTILFPLSSLVFQHSDYVNKNCLVPLEEQTIRFRTNLATSPFRASYEAKINELITIYFSKDAYYQLGTKSLLLSLIYLFYLNNEIQESKKDITYKQLHREILFYINENYSEQITLDQIAAHFHMAPKYFSRYFKNIFHTTFTEYVTQLRLEKALLLLNNPDLSITEVALYSGFSSCSYFNKRFKSYFGKSPLKYLEAIKPDYST